MQTDKGDKGFNKKEKRETPMKEEKKKKKRSSMDKTVSSELVTYLLQEMKAEIHQLRGIMIIT
jgi:hypothetical protein